jgi:alkylation response protein AidB-like acyl-CoA dehydrogenase
MNFEPTDLQAAIAQQADRFVAREYGFEQRRALLASDTGFSVAHWASFAELGWLGLLVPEAHGGLGAAHADVMVLMEAFGRALVVEPYLASAVLATTALAGAPEARLAHVWLPRLAGGEARAALAYAEPDGRYDPACIATAAHPEGEGARVRLSGRKSVVLHAAGADALVVSAREAGGIALYLVPGDAPGLAVRGYATADGLRAAEVELDVTLDAAQRLAGPEVGFAVLDRALDAGRAALCAEAVGIMHVLLERTVNYLKTRVQFGRPIGQFQVLQHRAVDMYVALEARSLAMLAALRMAAPERERRAAVSAAKQRIGELGHRLGQAAVQLHGGIGVTDELDVAHYFKRLTMLDHWLGDADFHLGRFRAAAA